MYVRPWPSYASPPRFPALPLLQAFEVASSPPSPLTVSATDAGWRVRAELPGLADDDVRVEATADSLQVSVSHKDAAPEGYTRIHRERKDLAFTERFRFRTPIHVEGVEASVKDGVLTIDVPRAPATTPRLIPVTH